jgi:heptosyltransferase-3
MRLLLIKPKHIGDTLLLTPTIAAIKSRYPDAEIGVVVRRGCEGILAGCPHIQRILTVAPVERQDRRRNDFWRELAVLLRLWSVKFDFVFELGDGHRARFLALFNRAARRYSVKPVAPLKPREQRSFTAVSRFDWEKYHRVEKDFYSVSEFLPLTPLVPSLIFERKSTQPWAPAEPLQDFALMQIGTRQGFNTWSREGWLAVGEGLLRRFEHLVISCGPVAHERQDARWVHAR